MPRPLALIAALVGGLFAMPALAEKCWLLGCSDNLGYVRTQPHKLGQARPFAGDTLPAADKIAVLCEMTHLRSQLIAQPLGDEDPSRVLAQPLGRGTTVKVLEYVERRGVKFAAVRVVEDALSCPDVCGTCGAAAWY